MLYIVYNIVLPFFIDKYLLKMKIDLLRSIDFHIFLLNNLRVPCIDLNRLLVPHTRKKKFAVCDAFQLFSSNGILCCIFIIQSR